MWPFLGVLCLEPTTLTLPAESTVYDVTRRPISPQQKSYPVMGALHGLEKLLAPDSCGENAAVMRAFGDTLAEEWWDRRHELSAKKASRPPMLRCLTPLAEVLAALTDWRAVKAEVNR